MKKRENIVIIVVLIVMVISIIGVSYAAFRFSQTGNTANTITTGSITMTYTESSNTISINGALPTTDKTGTVRLNPGEYFDFNVSSEITGDVNINYEISAKEVGDGTIDGSNIKLYLTKLNDGGSEEALMVPETYNEESSANDYTGRPTGEMSLYTSSMNSSESNNYRLRMYVDEGYNPQGDGGGLTFSVRINVYGQAGDKYVPLTTQEILEDNELQEEKENMFNYASNGNYIDMSSGPQNNPEYVTNGLYSAEDEDGISYYFRGNVDNNNVQFGEYESDYYVYQKGSNYYQSLESCQDASPNCSESNRVKLASAGDKMYWKLVRINGDGSLRLIYNGTSVNPTNSDIANSFIIAENSYVRDILNEINDPKYTGYTYDNGTDSFIKKEVDIWYENALGSTVYDRMVSSGRFCSDSSGYKPASEYGFSDMDGDYVFASFDRLGQIGTNYAKPNRPTLKCPSTSESYGGSYRLKAGLITADELVLAGNNFGVTTDSYLNSRELGIKYWSMTPAEFLYGRANVWHVLDYDFSYITVSNILGIRPVINVTSVNGFDSGDGSAETPYVIS